MKEINQNVIVNIIIAHSERALFDLISRVEARGTIVPRPQAAGTIVQRDDTIAILYH